MSAGSSEVGSPLGGGGAKSAASMTCFLSCVALHSLVTGLILIAQPDALMDWAGWGGMRSPFFPAQGGVFHVLMAVLYGRAARRVRERSLLVPYIVFVKVTAAVFLLSYYCFVEQIPLILASGLFDGGIAAVLAFARRPGRPAAARRIR